MGATPQTLLTPQEIAQKTLAASRMVFHALVSGDSTKHYAFNEGLDQWYEDLEKNVLGRAKIDTYYLHTLYKAFLDELFKIGFEGPPNDTSKAIKAFVPFYRQLLKDSVTATKFAIDPEQDVYFMGGFGIPDIEYE